MSFRRACPLVVAFSLVALGVVYLRTEQSRSAAEALKLEAEWIELRRERWTLQARAARLRTPERIHECVQTFEVDLSPPSTERLWTESLNDPFYGSSFYSP
ncbi:MAG: hypothetical protein JSV78_12295 [Phycisphaerales bacterium]|nr:MAG: hypothetical protein JSV78_12295 [Phycisphaerales bacterium]